MSLPRSIEQRGLRRAAACSSRARGAAGVCLLIVLPLLVSACSSFPSLPFPRSKKAEPAPTTTTSSTSSSGGTLSNTPTAAPPSSQDAGATTQGAPATAPASTPEKSQVDEKGRRLFSFGRKKAAPATATTATPGAPVKPAEVPPKARADFDSAVNMMRAGNTVGAQDAFQRLAQSYPQFASPEINLGLLYRKAGQLDKSEEALQEAVNRNRDSAVAWNELGVTQRMRGEFKVAQDSYENAIRVEPEYAPAYRNLGVLLDLYVGDPEGALDNFERYKELSKEEKPVSGWIAELRARTGKPPIRNKPVAPASDSAPGAAPADNAPADAAAPADSAPANSAAPADGGASPPPADSGAAPASTPPSAAPAEPKRG
jgi:Flp pilus assembly protein TadD